MEAWSLEWFWRINRSDNRKFRAEKISISVKKFPKISKNLKNRFLGWFLADMDRKYLQYHWGCFLLKMVVFARNRLISTKLSILNQNAKKHRRTFECIFQGFNGFLRVLSKSDLSYKSQINHGCHTLKMRLLMLPLMVLLRVPLYL